MGPLRRWWLGRRHGEGPWAALFAPPPENEWVSLDLETTGLDPRHDAVLSLAAVPVRDDRVLLSQRFETLVHPQRGFDIASIRHHRLTPAEVAGAPPLREVLPHFLRWLGPRRLLGLNIGFDLAMLDPAVRLVTGFPLPNPSVDLARAYRPQARLARPEGVLDLSLEGIAADLGVPVLARHTALGDAVTVALAWLALRAR
ncbi:exonuclease domain-containing protein [Arenimonas fontis]|uniref:3'-5' exonuclease n=1 Tax=Arenimonas fontis TaxID=2608255 RepID=A0A5B2Z7H9_9GAMM|nr:exonuclease domain-containing protein [Arenimonas fontis]KAA2284708.1 3'-5' exonuclease [Arenimonas fontis]